MYPRLTRSGPFDWTEIRKWIRSDSHVWDVIIDINKVCFALFFQLALLHNASYNYNALKQVVLCDNPSRLLFHTVSLIYVISRDNEIRYIFLKQFLLINLDIITGKHPWFSHWTWRNSAMFKHRSVGFGTIPVPFTRVDNGLGQFIILIDWPVHDIDWECPLRFTL